MSNTKKVTKLSPDQVEAIEEVMAWWKSDRQTFALAGYAGTGKTTVIAKLLDEMVEHVAVVAPTGKAALRLREKGVRDACTIHQLVYKFDGLDENEEMVFRYIGSNRGQVMVIVDEASMVNQKIYDDLIGDGHRILFVGDHGQLAPVGGDPGIMRRPDFALSVIHRQDDKGLLDFAHALRDGHPCPPSGGAAQVLTLDPWGESDEVLGTLHDASMVICWRNKTRNWLNHRIMQLRGLLPMTLRYDPELRENVSDVIGALGHQWFPLVCLRNDYKMRVFNGQTMDARIDRVEKNTVFAVLRDDAGNESRAMLDIDGFRLDHRGYEPRHGHVLADFGACLTAHKSQGSEWSHVCVWDDTFPGMDDRARWAYTAATRAQDKLTWLKR